MGFKIGNMHDHLLPLSTGTSGTPIKYRFVTSHVVLYIPHKWKEFGNVLFITPKKLNEIKDHNQNDHRRFSDVVQQWQS